MDPFDQLGITADADEAAIKRAYARRLKTTRPDDDPAGFQRLNEAYQKALHYARFWQDNEDIGDTEDDGAVAIREIGQIRIKPDNGGSRLAPAIAEPEMKPEPVSNVRAHAPLPPAPVTFDAADFHREVLLRITGTGPANEFATWLEHHPALYALRLKQQAGRYLFERLAVEQTEIPEAHLAILGRFFDRDHRDLHNQMRLRAAIRNELTAAYGEPQPFAIRQLKRRFRWPQALLVALLPDMPKRIRNLGWRLTDVNGKLPDGLQAAQLEFFQRLADPGYFGPWRWWPPLIRAALVAMAAAIVIPWAATRPLSPWTIGTWTLATVAGVQLALMFVAWQKARMTHADPARVTLWALLPVLLAGIALCLDAALPMAWPAIILAGIATLMHWRRTFDALRFLIGGLAFYSVMPQLHALCSSLVVGLVAVPFGLTLFDGLYAHHHRMPLPAVAGNRWTRIASYAFLIGWVLQSIFAKVT